jgi:hypothetical protein
MDLSVEFRERDVRIRAFSSRGERWLDHNFSCGETFMMRSENGPMFLRALDEERFDLHVTRVDVVLRDYDDQYSELLIARSKRLAGRPDEALSKLARLRAHVLLSDRKSATLLPEIDREIAAAFASCRRDRDASTAPPALRPPGKPARSPIGAWLRRTASTLDSAMLRIAISIVLMAHLYKFVVQGIA